MNILIICTWFFPDTAIAAVRPSMFAKYLNEFGHNVTVLRSGNFQAKGYSDDNNVDKGIEVITYLGDRSPAKKLERGEWINPKKIHSSFKERLYTMPPKVSRLLFEIKGLNPIGKYKLIKSAKYNYKKAIEAIKKMKDRQFDIVFSTYGNLENLWLGEYASKEFKSRWIMDFRDPVVARGVVNCFWNLYTRAVQYMAVEKSDASTAVSDGLSRLLESNHHKTHVYTLYNGYDSDLSKSYLQNTDKEHLTICYTGTMHKESTSALEALIKNIMDLFHSGKMDCKKIKFKYAGGHSEIVKSIFKKYDLSAVLDDYGYVSQNEVKKIQQESDLFLVLSWNTKKSQGVLTGKLYEGIRAGRPILSMLVGDVPKSELWELNQKYNYGYCYEKCCGKNADEELKLFLLDMYEKKFSEEGILYKPDPDFKRVFHYKNITKQLEKLCLELLGEEGKYN